MTTTTPTPATATHTANPTLADRYNPTDTTRRHGTTAARAPQPGREPFTMLMPPPNITGNLHIGHAYEHIMSDAAIRYHRMNGHPTMWQPGLDHAGIATQNIIERDLATRNLTRHDIGRDTFSELAWAHKHTTADTIINQLARLNTTPDWDRLQFTLDPHPQHAIRTLFCRLHNDGHIYQAERETAWCNRCTTALADIETDTDENGTPTCSRCHTQTEQRTTTQWFLATKHLAQLARDAHTSGQLTIEPAAMADDYLTWCDNMHDWCISRQLWWGHRIPIWYSPDRTECAAYDNDNDIPDGWTQDDDILDTWFSSALWPATTTGWPDTNDTNYPYSTLYTGSDLMFFWAIRMIAISTYATGTPPFRTLHFHGMIRDEHGKKMSKSFGNTIDPNDYIDTYGTDTLRLALCTKSRAGADLPFGTSDMDGAKATLNKLWNTARYIATAGGHDRHDSHDDGEPGEATRILTNGILRRLEQCRNRIDDAYQRFDIGDAARTLHQFLHDDLSSTYIELTKDTLRTTGADAQLITATLNTICDTYLQLLHPICPDITDTITATRGHGPLDNTNWPQPAADNSGTHNADATFNDLQNAITRCRSHKADLGLPQAATLPARIRHPHLAPHLRTAARLTEPADNFTAAATITIGDFHIELPGADSLTAQQHTQLTKRTQQLEQRIRQLDRQLTDNNFLTRAPNHAINTARQQHNDLTNEHTRLDALLHPELRAR